LQNDAELILNALQGDLEAYAPLVIRYSNALYSIAYSITGDFHLSQDIAQDSFIKAFDRLKLLKDPEKFCKLAICHYPSGIVGLQEKG